MADLKPVYLLHGDDEVKLDAARARVRERAVEEGASLDLMDGERDGGDAVAAALSAMTLAMGRRYVVVDRIEKWKDKDVVAVVGAVAVPAPETVVFLFGTARKETGRKPWSPSPKLTKAVEQAGGKVTTLASPKPAALPAWVIEQGKDLGLAVDRDAAQALVARVGTRQRRLQRTLERIAGYGPDRGRVDVDLVEALTVSDVEAQGYQLADAVIEGDRALALRVAENLSDRDEDIMYILYAMLRRTRDMRRVWALLEEGRSTKDVESALRVPTFVAKRMAAQARSLDGERLERLVAGLADLDFAIRGGGKVDTQTALTLTLAA
jgi:DNA polymerase-3 subunit delta